jgi:NADH dehydrogenase/NADH:ubiquinone oxidoreductase subunit G
MSDSVPIICPYCGVGCNLELQLDDKGIPTKSSASGRNKTVNGKYLCLKGFAIHELVTSEERLTHPHKTPNMVQKPYLVFLSAFVFNRHVAFKNRYLYIFHTVEVMSMLFFLMA